MSTRVAVVQAACVGLDTDASLVRLSGLAERAAANGARLVVFPEAFLGGYPKGARFGSVVGHRTDQGRAEFARYMSGAISMDGPQIAALAELAATQGIWLVVGTIERDGNTLYNTIVIVSPETGLAGRHRKVMPTGAERLIWGFGDATTLDVVDTPFGRLGAVTCWENYMPALRLAMYAKQIQIYCAPTADSRETWVASMRHVAREGRCFVLSSCMHLVREDLPPDVGNELADDPHAVLMQGGSCIVDPLGRLLAGPTYEPEDVLYSDIDLGAIDAASLDFDAVGHYARPDLFTVTVHDAAQTPVVFEESTS